MIKSGNFVITNSRLSLLYQPVANVRRKAFDIEDALTPQFLSPAVIPVPDDAPPEIPRIQLTSKNGHSTLSVTPIRIDLNTTYDKAYANDLDLSLAYVREKAKSVERVFEIIEPDAAIFALHFKVRWPCPGVREQDFLDQYSSKLLPKSKTGARVHNFRVHSSFEASDTLFKLITYSNYRVFDTSNSSSKNYPRFEVEDEVTLLDFGLEKEIEVNDRLAYNRGTGGGGIERIEEFIEVLKPGITDPTLS